MGSNEARHMDGDLPPTISFASVFLAMLFFRDHGRSIFRFPPNNLFVIDSFAPISTADMADTTDSSSFPEVSTNDGTRSIS